MKKVNLRGVFILAICLALYHVLVFLLPFDRGEVFWYAYGSALAAFGVAILAICMVAGKHGARSRFYGFPIGRIGVTYALWQLVISLLFMLLGGIIPTWIVLLVSVIGLGAALLGLIAADSVRTTIEAQDEKLRVNTATIRSLRSKISLLSAQNDDPETTGAIRKLSDEFRYSDPVSSPALAEIEADLAALVNELQQATVDGDSTVVLDLCKKISLMLQERNRICKLNK